MDGVRDTLPCRGTAADGAHERPDHLVEAVAIAVIELGLPAVCVTDGSCGADLCDRPLDRLGGHGGRIIPHEGGIPGILFFWGLRRLP